MYRSYLLLACLCAAALLTELASLQSASPLLLYVSAASQYPGLPTGFNTVLRCCSAHSMLPRDKLVFTKGGLVYEYDSIMQETIQVMTTDTLWAAPLGNGATNLPHGDFNATLWWSNDKAYWFWSTHYWKYRYNDGGSEAGQSDTAGGWMGGIDNMDAFWLMSTEWSYSTVGDQVFRYDNVRDTGDTTVNWPRSVYDEFGADFPASVDDADIHPERQVWALFKANQIFMYNFASKTMLPGYPRPIHQDAIDGGTNGMMRTRCSGIMDLSSMIGFVEDKSPVPSLRLQNYAADLNCEWSIIVPSLVLRAYGYNGYRWIVDRFDLGAGAKLEIAEMHDKPAEADIAKADWNWSQWGLYTPEYTPIGGENSVVPINNTTPIILATYDSAHPPTLNTLSNIASSKDSMTLRVRFSTPSDAAINIGTGFALRFAVATSTITTYTRHNGVVWFSSLGVASDMQQTAIVKPDSQTPATIAFSCRINMYPYDSSKFNQVSLTASDGNGQTIQICTGASLFDRGMVAPRCKFQTTAAQYPVTLTMSTGAFATNVMCEYVATSYCNSDVNNPQVLTALSGIVEDGSGDKDYYRMYSSCHWLIQPPASSGALFVSYKFSALDLIVVSYFGDSGVPPGVTRTDYTGFGTVTIYDGVNRTFPVVRTLTYTDSDTSKTYASTGPAMRLSFETSLDIGHGWSGSYKVHFAPVISTITMQKFSLSSSPAISAQLSALKSVAQSMVRAGTKQAVTLFGTNKAQEPISWEFATYQAYYRWIPVNIDSAAASALALYPLSLSTTNFAFWSARFTSLTQAQLDSIVEIASTGASIPFAAPTLTGDYHARLVISIYSKEVDLPSADGWGKRNVYLPNYYSVLAADEIVHVAPDTVTHDMSSAFAPGPSFNFTSMSQDWTEHYDTLKQLVNTASPVPTKSAKFLSKASSTTPALNLPIEAGSTFAYIIVARDQYGNIREGFEKDDVRGYLGSELALSSPTVRMQTIAPGLYYFSVRPTIASDDYLLTVLVAGMDILTGPFYPVVLPSVTDAGHCTAVVDSTGQSVLTTSLPAGQSQLVIRVTAYDRFNNVQMPSVVAVNDTMILSWPGHDVQFLSQNGSSWLYTVSTPVEFGTSVMTLRVNNAPLGFDPSQSATMSFASGISVSTGIPRVIDQPTPVGLQGSLTAISALLMVLTVLLMLIVHRYRAVPIIRASSPKFLQVMLVGALLLYASVIAMAIPTPNDASCALVPLLAHLGFFAIFGSLFVKTQRVRTIFTATKLQVQVLPDSRLMAQLGIMSMVYLVYYAIWMGVARPKPVELAFDLTGYVVCASEYSVFPAIPLVVEGLITVYGAYLAARIWSIPSLFNESKFLLASIYNVAVIGGLLLILVKLIITSPQVQLGFSAFGVLFVTTVVLVLMFVSKLHSVLSGSGATGDAEGDKTAFGNKTAGMETHASAMSGGGDTATPITKGARLEAGAQVQAVSDDMNPNSHKTSSSTRGTPLAPIRTVGSNSPNAAKYAMNSRGPASPSGNRAPLASRIAPSSPTNAGGATPVVVHPDSSPVSQESQYPQKTTDELVTSDAPASPTSAQGTVELALIAQPQLPGEVDSADGADSVPAPATTE